MNTISLPVEFTQPSLGKLHDEVDALVKDKQSFRLDGSLVERVDAAAIQYLLICRKTMSSESEQQLLNPSEVLTAALEFLARDSNSASGEASAQTQ